MVEIARRDLVLGGLFTSLAAACFGLTPKRAFPRLSDDQLAQAIPQAFGPYRVASTDGLILPPEDELSKKLYDKVVTRVYEGDGLLPVMALFAYGSTQNLTLQLHRPDKCYPMQGFTLSPVVTTTVRMAGHMIPAAITTAARNERSEQLLYWSRIGTEFPADRWRETWLVARENFRGWMPDGILVRLSSINSDREAAVAQMRDFAQMLGAALPPLGKRILMGTGI